MYRFLTATPQSNGIDGSETNAGAFADGNTAALMRRSGIDPGKALSSNDAYSTFGAINGLFSTGPTGTNVNDFRAIAVGVPDAMDF